LPSLRGLGWEALGSILGLMIPSAAGLAAYYASATSAAYAGLAINVAYLGFRLAWELLAERRVDPDPILMGFAGVALLAEGVLAPALLVMLLYSVAEFLEQ